jgi:hypothetical protein
MEVAPRRQISPLLGVVNKSYFIILNESDGGFGYEISLLPVRISSYGFSVPIFLPPMQCLERCTRQLFGAIKRNTVFGICSFRFLVLG